MLLGLSGFLRLSAGSRLKWGRTHVPHMINVGAGRGGHGTVSSGEHAEILGGVLPQAVPPQAPKGTELPGVSHHSAC